MPLLDTLGTGNLRYRLIARNLAAAIGRGKHPVGSRLPTEGELCRHFGASRFTVRQALAMLRDQGLIASRRGIGTVVLALAARHDYVESFGTVEDVIRQGLGMPLTVSRTSDVVADAKLAGEIGCDPGNAMLLIEGLRYSGGAKSGTPLGWSEVYVPAVYDEIRGRLGRLRTTIAQLIVDTCGVSIARIDQQIVAVSLPAAVARQLDAKTGGPALEILRWYRDANGAVFQIARSFYPSGRYVHRSRILPGSRSP